MHRNEGALGVIQSVSTQLENAKACLQDLQSSATDGPDVQREKTRIIKLEMTLETLQADIEYEDCSDALVLMQKEVELKESKLKLRNAQMDFVARYAAQERFGFVASATTQASSRCCRDECSG